MGSFPLLPWEMRVASAVLGTMFPAAPEHGIDHGIEAMGLEAFLEETRKQMPPLAAWGLRMSLWVVAWAPVVVLGRLRWVHHLDEAHRLQVLEALAASRFYLVRQIIFLLKATGALLYGAHPQVRAWCLEGSQGKALGDSPPPAPDASGPRLVVLGRRRKDAA
jgi:hypothetical protein